MGFGAIIAGAMGGVGENMVKEEEQRQKAQDAMSLEKIRSEMTYGKELALLNQKGAIEERLKKQRINAVLGAHDPDKAGNLSSSSNQPDTFDSKIQKLSEKTGISPDVIRVDLLSNEGKGLAKMIEDRQKPDIQIINGVAIDKNKAGEGVVPAVHTTADGKSIYVTPGEGGSPNVSVPKGAQEAYGAYQGIQAGVQAATKPIKVFNPETQREEYVPESAVLGLDRKSQPSANKIDPALQLERDRGRLETVGSELTAAKAQLQQAITSGETKKAESLKGDVDALGREYATIEKKVGQSGNSQLSAQAGETKKGNYAAGPSSKELASKDSYVEINKSFVKNTLEPTVAAGTAAVDMIDSVKATRDAIQNMGGTGWTTETKPNAASMLEGLGLATEKAKVYAQSSQHFQNQAMKQLQLTLNLAKGAQTEGDAVRASKTFAELGNTTKANEFILDLIEARSQRDIIKSKFFQNSLPHAQQSGDLAEIEREWLKVQPSVFKLPSMAKWGVQ